MAYRLGIDMGSTSIGWCVVKTKGSEITDAIDMGVRIFPDGRDAQSKTPLAVNRRQKRGMRRSLDRRMRRKRKLMNALVRLGLMPADLAARKALEALNPYQLRKEALERPLSAHELGRALFHICQRRGFKSNRKSDKKEKDTGSMKTAIRELREAMGGKTLGAYLYSVGFKDTPGGRPAHTHKSVRVKARQVRGKNEYNLYPGREMYLEEVDAILEAQKQRHAVLTEEATTQIKDIIFFQRPLKAQQAGLCRFEGENGERRMRKAYPLFQKFRILQEVNNLDLEQLDETTPHLTRAQKEKIVEALLLERHLTFHKIRKLLKLPSAAKFNLEADNRDRLQGDETYAELAAKDCFGEAWVQLTPQQQDAVVTKIIEEENEQSLVAWLVGEYAVSEEQAENIAQVSLDEDFGSLSRKAIEKILPGLEKGMIYSDACKAAGYHHSDFRTGEVFDQLPYYGEVLRNAVMGGTENPQDIPEKRHGKLNNPTVHIALNQLRRVVNAIVEKHGHPDQVVIELARDLPLGEDGLNELKSDQAKNKKRNDKINAELAKLGVKQNYANRLIFKLWEDLSSDPAKRCCPFTGRMISVSQIFTGEFEVEHLLPFSRSFNDSPANKVLSYRDANRFKGNRSPFEAFSDSPAGYKWEDIVARAANLPDNKRWRFSPEAWERAKGQEEDIIARMLVDTQYMARLAKQYVSFICHPDRVWTIPGRLTAMMRDKWGLNDLLGEEDGRKERGDHRHHALDAFVVACTTRAMLKNISAAANAFYENDAIYSRRLKLVEKMPEPFPGYYQRMETLVENMIVSYKPDHGNAHQAIDGAQPFTIGALHQETAMGYVGKGEKKATSVYVTRKPLDSMLTKGDIEGIADPTIRQRLLDSTDGLAEKSDEWKQALRAFSEKSGTKRLRVHTEKSDDVMVGIRKKDKPEAQPYKYYALGGNYCAEIYCPNKGDNAGKWCIEITQNYYAHQKNHIPQWRKDNPTAKLIMRLQIDDMVAYEEDGKTIYTRLKKMTGGRVYLRPHNIAVESGDQESWAASPNLLQQKQARKIAVDPMGRIRDPMKQRDGADRRNNEGRLSSGA